MKTRRRTIKESIKSFFKKTLIVTVIVMVIILVIFFNTEETPIEQVDTTKGTTIINDVSSVFEGLKDFSKRSEVRKKVEMVEKEAFLQDKKETIIADYQKELAEIENALDEVRGELSVS